MFRGTEKSWRRFREKPGNETASPIRDQLRGVDLLRAAVEVKLNTIAVVFDFMKPLVTLGCLSLEGRQLGAQ